MLRAMLCVLALALLSSPASAAGRGLVLDSKATILLRPDETGPVRKAAADLASDLTKVLGARPRIVIDPAAAGPETIEIAPRSGGPAESFAIRVSGNRVLLTGADMRGAIYAIYHFSQEYLGVDPMYFWTDHLPARRTQIVLPDGLDRAYPAPVFKYRGFFINDEDQLTGWAPGEAKDHSGISLAVMDRIYETVLRLKGNMVVPSTWSFPTDGQMKAAGERGLILTQHHAIPVGMDVARWPAGVPYSLSAHPEILERAWRNAVRSYDPKQEILWSVGLRGLSDTSYASMDPSVVGDDKRQGELISQAIATQMRIVRERFPNAQFVTDLWQEGTRLKREGYLNIPPEVTTVWADRGYGLVQDGGQVEPGQGFYYHVAMLNGSANQLSEMVPVARIQSEFGRYIKAGATQYVLVNTSDLRAVAMTAKAVMNLAWGGLPEAGGAHGYYLDWAEREFGTKAAPTIARLYQDYFAAIPHRPNGDDYGDNLYHSETRQLMLSTMVSPPYYDIPGQAPKWEPAHIIGIGAEPQFWLQIRPDYIETISEREVKTCAEAAPRWDKVWQEAKAAEALVPPDRRPYYDYALLTMIAINRDGNHMLLQISRAARDAKAGRLAQAKGEARSTLADFAEIKALQTNSEYGEWPHWWRGEWLVGIDDTHAMVETFLKWLDDPLTRLPPPVLIGGWQGYYHILHYEGDEVVDVN